MTKQRNREQIQQLQKENKELREQLKSRGAQVLNNTGSNFVDRGEKDLVCCVNNRLGHVEEASRRLALKDTRAEKRINGPAG